MTPFWLILEPLPPHVTIMIFSRTRPVPPANVCAASHFLIYNKAYWCKISFKNGQKMSRDILVDPLPPQSVICHCREPPPPKVLRIIWMAPRLQFDAVWASLLHFFCRTTDQWSLTTDQKMSYINDSQELKLYHSLSYNQLRFVKS